MSTHLPWLLLELSSIWSNCYVHLSLVLMRKSDANMGIKASEATDETVNAMMVTA